MLTVDPVLQAYRTDRLSGVNRSCPQPTGDLFCDQVSYAPLLTLGPAVTTKAAASASGGGGSSTVWVIVAI